VIAGSLAAVTTPFAVHAQGQLSRITAYAFSFPALEAGDIRLAEYTGRPFLVVNTASPRHSPAAIGVWILAAATTGAAVIQFARDVRHETLQVGPVASLRVVRVLQFSSDPSNLY